MSRLLCAVFICSASALRSASASGGSTPSMRATKRSRTCRASGVEAGVSVEAIGRA
jgi:hypothetical protein